MKIKLFYIGSRSEGAAREFEERYVKRIKPFSLCEILPILSSDVKKAQKISAAAARSSYTEALKPRVEGCYSVALNKNGKMLNSAKFSDALKDHTEIGFFIGGAYGLEGSFIDSCDLSLSLSLLTFPHELSRIILLEQIYRAKTIERGLPYHK
ncbi:MAG: 23S rRNA (pseudouridine(1915)-N(3))-methyltransferase RlmH [Helicobacteraceae bacterium]|nr:23S rRNA (pseudouridine(1915)-N(3))-methyltransferase RlmH [Helicobacteraceae bacterium]